MEARQTTTRRGIHRCDAIFILGPRPDFGPSQKGELLMTDIKNVLLIHGGFVDGSGWQGVYGLLKADGFNVRIVQNPTITLAGDVAATIQIVEAQEGPVVLVGHSYGRRGRH